MNEATSGPAQADPVTAARDYYNSNDADTFYASIWGGEDIHVGLYESADDSIATASRRTVQRLADLLEGLTPSSRLLDLGSGYGGAARHLVRRFSCSVVALNLSETENTRARRLNREQGVAASIDVVDGAFESLPFADASFDAVWSQDAILHSSDRQRVLHEAARVLKTGGQMVFTDPMQADDCPPGVLDPILARIHLRDLGSLAFYRTAAARAGLTLVRYRSLTPHLVTHYTRVHQALQQRRDVLTSSVSAAFLTRMEAGLRHWVEGGERGHLAWGMFLLRKPGCAAID
ncbi:MAG: SAM-dependent methyltransferase [Polyangiales bacterium]